MNELIERYKTIDIKLKLLLLLGMCGLVGYYSYEESAIGAEQGYEAAKFDAEKLDAEVAALSKSGQSVVAIEAELRKSDAEITNLLELLPSDSELDRVLGYFAIAARETGVEIKEFLPVEEGNGSASNSDGAPPAGPVPGAVVDPGRTKDAPSVPGAEKGASPVRSLPVSTSKLKVVLVGSFPQIVTFFDKTLSLPRILKIDSYTMKTNETDAKKLAASPRLNVEANYVAFSQKLNKGSEPGAPAMKLAGSLPIAEGAAPPPSGAAQASKPGFPPAPAAPDAASAQAPPPPNSIPPSGPAAAVPKAPAVPDGMSAKPLGGQAGGE